MLRLSELKLPLDHSEADLEAAVCRRLRLESHQLRCLRLVKRSVDARKPRISPPARTLTVNDSEVDRTAMKPQNLKSFGRILQLNDSHSGLTKQVGGILKCGNSGMDEEHLQHHPPYRKIPCQS